ARGATRSTPARSSSSTRRAGSISSTRSSRAPTARPRRRPRRPRPRRPGLSLDGGPRGGTSRAKPPGRPAFLAPVGQPPPAVLGLDSRGRLSHTENRPGDPDFTSAGGGISIIVKGDGYACVPRVRSSEPVRPRGGPGARVRKTEPVAPTDTPGKVG